MFGRPSLDLVVYRLAALEAAQKVHEAKVSADLALLQTRQADDLEERRRYREKREAEEAATKAALATSEAKRESRLRNIQGLSGLAVAAIIGSTAQRLISANDPHLLPSSSAASLGAGVVVVLLAVYILLPSRDKH